MPIVVNRGAEIHYTLDEAPGPLIVILHGLFGNAERWRELPLVQSFIGKARLVCVDSLGHGRSAKPLDQARYAREPRASDVVAVMDALGEERAHFIGYSMGGWWCGAIAKYFPQRLSSLVIGGYDVVGGLETYLPDGRTRPYSWEEMVGRVRANRPALLEGVSSADERGIAACYEAENEVGGAGEAVLSVGCPVLFWCGVGDPTYPYVKQFAEANGLPLLSAVGDHASALRAPEVVPAIQAFIASADLQSQTA